MSQTPEYPGLTGFRRWLTPRAQKALALSRSEAERLNHTFLGTEHVLVGLIASGKGVAVDVLERLGVDLESVRKVVEKQIGPSPDSKAVANIYFAPGVEEVLRIAAKEAKALNHTYIGTEHILLGLLREGEGGASRVLRQFGVDIDKTIDAIRAELDPNHPLDAELNPSHPLNAGWEWEVQSCELTPRAEQALTLARQEADRLNHQFAGTEHILLGLFRLNEGVAVNVLKKLGLVFETIRIEIEKQVGTGPCSTTAGYNSFTPRVKKVLDLAFVEAMGLKHDFVGTEHILLGLLREGDGVAARLLRDLDVDLEQTCQEILNELATNGPFNAGRKLRPGIE